MSKLHDLVRPIPLFGALADCSGKDHRATLGELSATLLFSTMPFWLGALVLFATSTALGKTYPALVISTLNKGELLIFSTSLLAPIFFTAFSDPAGAKAFPSRYEHAVLIAILIAVCAAMFGVQKSGVPFDNEFVFGLSLITTAFALVLRYLASIYHRMRTRDAPEAMRDDTDAFVKSMKNRLGG